MTVTEILHEVVETTCRDYCKYPDEYLAKIKDVDEAQETMIDEVCSKCPLSRLV